MCVVLPSISCVHTVQDHSAGDAACSLKPNSLLYSAVGGSSFREIPSTFYVRATTPRLPVDVVFPSSSMRSPPAQHPSRDLPFVALGVLIACVEVRVVVGSEAALTDFVLSFGVVVSLLSSA